MHRSAHILGAVAVTLGWRSRLGAVRSIVFSGDIGGNTPANRYQSLLAGQSLPGAADYMVVEGTRGGEPARSAHYKSFEGRMTAWSTLLADSDARGGGPVIVPCFAIHRAQELLFDLDFVLRTTPGGRADEQGRPRWLSLDAPLAVKMTDVFAATATSTHCCVLSSNAPPRAQPTDRPPYFSTTAPPTCAPAWLTRCALARQRHTRAIARSSAWCYRRSTMSKIWTHRMVFGAAGRCRVYALTRPIGQMTGPTKSDKSVVRIDPGRW